MTGARALSALGAAAASARRAGLGRALGVTIDTIDGLLLRAGRPPLAAKVDGLEFRGYLRHRGFLEYLGRGMTEESYYRRLVLGAVDSGTTFVDAGAHIGVYTLLVCRRARRVLTFEPDPYNLAALRVNVTRGGCANVEIRAETLADRTGRAPFRAFRSTPPTDPWEAGLLRVARQSLPSGQDALRVGRGERCVRSARPRPSQPSVSRAPGPPADSVALASTAR